RSLAHSNGNGVGAAVIEPGANRRPSPVLTPIGASIARNLVPMIVNLLGQSRLRPAQELAVTHVGELPGLYQKHCASTLDYLLGRPARVTREVQREPAHHERFPNRDPLAISRAVTGASAVIGGGQPDLLELTPGLLGQGLEGVIPPGVQRTNRLGPSYHGGAVGPPFAGRS